MTGIPRQNLEAEQSTLGAMLLDKHAAAVAAVELTEASFYRQVHGRIFSVIVDLHRLGVLVDLITLANELQRRGALDEVGGQGYLMTLVNSVPGSSNIDRYCIIVREASEVRELVTLAHWLNEQGGNEGALGPNELRAQIMQTLDAQRTKAQSGMIPMADIVADVFARMEAVEAGEVFPRFPTGFAMVDDHLDGGLSPGHLVVIAGWPKMGKTTLALNIAARQAHDVKVAISSLEMAPHDLSAILIAQTAGVNARTVRKSMSTKTHISDEERQAIQDAQSSWYDRLWWIGGQRTRDVDSLIDEALRLHMRQRVDLWVIDHAQKLTSRRHHDLRESLEYCARALSDVARTSGMCIILLSQCRKQSQGANADRPPTPHDMKEASALMEEPSVAMILHRALNEDGTTKRISLDLALNRFGPSDSCEIGYDPKLQRFLDIDREHSDEGR